MAKAALTPNEVLLLITARTADEALRAAVRKQVFATAKARHGIPDAHKLRVEIDDTRSPMYGVLVRKKDGTTYDVGTTMTKPRWFKAAVDVNVVDYDYDWADGVETLPSPHVSATDGDGNTVAVCGDTLYVLRTQDDIQG